MSEVGVSNAVEYGLAHGYTAEQAMDSVYGTGEFEGMGMGYETVLYDLYGSKDDNWIIQDILDHLSTLHTQYAVDIAWVEIYRYRDYAGNTVDASSAQYVEIVYYR